jgi:Tfp pilus assembly protein FimT
LVIRRTAERRIVLSQMKHRRSGFTIFELVLVMVLIIIFAGLSYPTVSSMIGGFRAQAAVDQVRAVWAQARAKAMNDGLPYGFSVIGGSGNFRVAPDLTEFWSGTGNTEAAVEPGTKPLLLEQALAKGVIFSSAQAGDRVDDTMDTSSTPGSADPSAWSVVAVFLPDGTARSDAELVIRASGARAVLIRLRGLTGVVTTGPL